MKDPDVFPEFDDTLSEALHTETKTFLSEVAWKGDGRLETIFTAPYSYVDSTLARFYGAPAGAGSGFSKTALPPERSGI